VLRESTNNAFKTILPHDLTDRAKGSKEKSTRQSNNSNNSNKSKISTVFKELVRENQLNKQKNFKEAKQSESQLKDKSNGGIMHKTDAKGSISSLNGLVKLSLKSAKSNDSIAKSINTAEKLLAEKKVVIPNQSIKKKKKTFFGKLFKRFRKKKNNQKAISELKKGITSTYNIDET
jgi:hypothetical protein